MPLRDAPSWWEWKLALTRHAEQRMMERGVTEVALRAMLKWAQAIRRSEVEGRYVVEATHEGCAWEVVVEPDDELKCIVVVTVYARE